jgi:hypothetical protein
MCLAAKGWFQGWADKLMLCAMGYLDKTHLKKSILIKYFVSLACVQRSRGMFLFGKSKHQIPISKINILKIPELQSTPLPE